MSPAAPAPRMLSRQRVGELVQPLIEDGFFVGMAVGLLTEQEQRVYGFGATAIGPGGAIGQPDEDTIFEVGSNTKAMTASILGQDLVRGRARLSDRLTEHLPSLSLPRDGQTEMVLLDLATHTSGLPKEPPNIAVLGERGDYDFDDLFAGMAQLVRLTVPVKGLQLAGPIGERYQYSNLGIALLATALGAGGPAAGREPDIVPFGQLLEERLAGPLGLESTFATQYPEQEPEDRRARYATPYQAPEPHRFVEVPPSAPGQALLGAGGARSTAKDMLRFLAAHLGLVAEPRAALAGLDRTHPIRHHINGRVQQYVGLVWQIERTGDLQFLTKGGLTSGMNSFVAFEPAHRAGALVLTNTYPDQRALAKRDRRLQDVVPCLIEMMLGRACTPRGDQPDVDT